MVCQEPLDDHSCNDFCHIFFMSATESMTLRLQCGSRINGKIKLLSFQACKPPHCENGESLFELVRKSHSRAIQSSDEWIRNVLFEVF